MSILNPASVYQLTRPGRIDPKFVGIGQVYMEHKHKRKQVEKIYNTTQNALIYTEKNHNALSKSLEEKEKELERLEKVRDRHNKDQQRKMDEQEHRRRKLEELKRKTSFQRKKLQSNLKSRMNELRNERRNDKKSMKQKSQQLNEKFRTSQHEKFTMRKTMYNTISQQKQQGSIKVDQFYRQRVLKSLSDYKKRIHLEDQKSMLFSESIEKMNQTISVLSRGNQKKERRLAKLEEKICELNPLMLKTFYSTKLDKNSNENSITFSRKTSLHSISSKKPSQILLPDQLESIRYLNEKHLVKDKGLASIQNKQSNQTKFYLKKGEALPQKENPEAMVTEKV